MQIMLTKTIERAKVHYGSSETRGSPDGCLNGKGITKQIKIMSNSIPKSIKIKAKSMISKMKQQTPKNIKHGAEKKATSMKIRPRLEHEV